MTSAKFPESSVRMVTCLMLFLTLPSYHNIAVSIPSVIQLSYIGLQDLDTSFG